MEKINIDYEQIDLHCRDMVKFFNEEVGLQTQFCCEGHDEDPANNQFYIIFHAYVTDEQIETFIKYLGSGTAGSFKKWVRMGNGRIHRNWQYIIRNSDSQVRFEQVEKSLEQMKYRHQQWKEKYGEDKKV